MPFTLETLTEDNVHESGRVRLAAFQSPIARVLRPDGPTPELRQYQVESDREACRNDKSTTFIAIRDLDTRELVGVGRWQKIDSDVRAKKDEPRSTRSLPSTLNKEAYAEFMSKLDQAKKRMIGDKDCWYCDIIAVDAQYQGKGIGKMLLQWGLDRAIRDNLDVYLDSTEAGLEFYKRYGFETLFTWTFDCTPFGIEYVAKQTPMVWHPGQKS